MVLLVSDSPLLYIRFSLTIWLPVFTKVRSPTAVSNSLSLLELIVPYLSTKSASTVCQLDHLMDCLERLGRALHGSLGFPALVGASAPVVGQ